jgi:hypothetical protein
MRQTDSPINLWHGQLLHLICIGILFGISQHVWVYLGKPQAIAFWSALAFPVAHQVFVWLSWRLELQSALTSRTIGFQTYLVVFFVLFAGRFVSLFMLAWLDRNTLELNSQFRTVTTAIFLFLGIYAMYSVRRYFGLARAAGADHFDTAYKSIPFVKEGIFRFTSNAMYVFAFLLFWAIAIGFSSASALLVAAFSHLYIWVHYYCTEKPDMDFIYGTALNENHS